MNEPAHTDSPKEHEKHFNELVLLELMTHLECRWQPLPDKVEEGAQESVRALWFAAAGERRSVEHALEGNLPVLRFDDMVELRKLIEDRHAGVPLAHLTGRQRFMGLEFLAGAQALIPRKETEILGHTALKLVRDTVAAQGGALVLDICCGSGNLGVALAALAPPCRVFASDLSADAVALARDNAALHKVKSRIEFRVGDLFAPFTACGFEGHVDVVVANPPYISTAKVGAIHPEIGQHEPRLAFDGGSYGLDLVTRIMKDAAAYLRPAGWLCFEIGKGQGRYLSGTLARDRRYRDVQVICDPAGEIRVLAAQRVAETVSS